MTIYYDWDQARSGSFPAMPAMLAIGDSWFWYPFVSNLLAELSAVVRPDYSNILALGRVGATLQQFAEGPYANDFARQLQPQFIVYYSAVLISGGGNDAVDWRLCLRDDCTGVTRAEECIDPASLDGLTSDLQGWLLALINEVNVAANAANRSPLDVFVHTYDYAPPNGEPARFPPFEIPVAGPWLKPALDRANVADDFALRQDIVKLLIDALQGKFFELDSPADRVHVIRTAGTLDPDVDWANELHPNGQGFRKLIHGPWLARLRETGYAT
jgi:hypothetical protein